MSFLKNVGYKKISRDRHVIGHERVENVALAAVGITGEYESVYELTLELTAAENVTESTPGYISESGVYAASPLISAGKPCNCIITETKSTGESVKVQIGGVCTTSLTLTANKDVFLRYGTDKISTVPIVAVTADEDTHQRLGRTINTSQILLYIETPKQLT